MTIDFKKDYILENHRVRLTPLNSEAFDVLVHFAIHEPELWKYSMVSAGSEEKMKNYINKALEDRQNETAYAFLVFDKLKNQYAGSTRFYDMLIDQKSTLLGYTWYGKNFQGTGINKHCKYLLLEFAFDNLKMERVEFRADNANARSLQAMKSIGCTMEGVLRKNTKRDDGSRRDSAILSILYEEWITSIKPNLRMAIES